jgi:hypothetical protein
MRQSKWLKISLNDTLPVLVATIKWQQVTTQQRHGMAAWTEGCTTSQTWLNANLREKKAEAQ